MIRRRTSFRPFATRGRGMTIAIIAMFALFSAVSVALSIRETSRARHRATVVEIAGRQRTLAERYVRETMLVHSGARADPAATAGILRASVGALIDGGAAPAVNGDDDETCCRRPRAWRGVSCCRNGGSSTTSPPRAAPGWRAGRSSGCRSPPTRR